MCGHLRKIVDNKSLYNYNSNFSSQKGYFSQCILFRNVLKKDFFDFNYNKIINGDTFLMLYLSNFGKFKILNFVGSAYRISDVGIWSLKDANEKYIKSTLSYNEMMEFFKKYNYNKSIKDVELYKIDNLIRYAIRLKKEKYIIKSIYYYFAFIFFIVIKRRITLTNIKTSIQFLIK